MDRRNSAVKVYGMDISLLEEGEVFLRMMDRLPENLRERVVKCRNDGDKKRRLAGFLLLLHALEETGHERLKNSYSENLYLNFSYSERAGGKPYLVDCPDFHFNISHSGKFAVCAVCDREIGIDIQQERALHGNIAARFFTQAENEKINGCVTERERRELFFRYWCAKEAYVKFTGEGLAQGLSHIEVKLAKGRIADSRFAGRREAYLWEQFVFDRTKEADGAEAGLPDFFLAVCGERSMKVEMEWIKEL